GCEGELVAPAGSTHPGARPASDAGAAPASDGGASRPFDAIVAPPAPTPGATPGTACAGNPADVPLTAEQRTALRALGPLPLTPPPDPTNRVANQPAAAALGQMLFFDDD